jgi:3-oxoacyl-[acyl-carrier protein] reductase
LPAPPKSPQAAAAWRCGTATWIAPAVGRVLGDASPSSRRHQRKSIDTGAGHDREAACRADILVASAGITGQTPRSCNIRRCLEAGDRHQPDRRVPQQPRRARGHGQARLGRIVNIASVAGKEGNPNASAYSASKAGVIGLTKSLGKELATTGVLVNCVAPAVVKTSCSAR